MSVAVFHASGKGQDGVGSKTEKTLGDFAAEYAKSNRSTCKGCMEKIEKVSESFGLHLADFLDFLRWMSSDISKEKKK